MVSAEVVEAVEAAAEAVVAMTAAMSPGAVSAVM